MLCGVEWFLPLKPVTIRCPGILMLRSLAWLIPFSLYLRVSAPFRGREMLRRRHRL